MKKLLILLIAISITAIVCGQEVLKRDLELRKTAPVLNLNGSGAVLQFYNGDVTLTQSSNLLTLSGGNLSLGANSLLGSGSIGATGTRLLKGWFTDLEITNLPTVNGATLASALSLAGYLLKSDTATMLTPYVARGDTASMLTPYVARGDTALMLTPYVARGDTASMLLPYAQLAEVYEAIRDSIQDRLDSADVAVSLATYQENVGNYFFRELQSMGLDAVGLPIGAAQPMTTNKTLADGVAGWQSFYLPVGDTITGVRFIQRTQGGYTAADSNCVALYSVSGATYTRVAVSANNGDLWKGSSYSLQSVAFTSPYIAAAGNYMVFFVYNQSAETTAPNIYCWNGSVGVSQFLTGTNAHRLSGTVSAEGGPPTTEVAGDLTASDVIYGVWLY